jgi:hypothetical protein
VLADAFVKGLDMNPNIDWTLEWEAMVRIFWPWIPFFHLRYYVQVKDAQVILPFTDNVTFDSGNLDGRGTLWDWINVGWLTRNHTRSLSRTTEYAQNDFSLYQIAKRTNPTADAKKYLSNARQWENL